MVIKKYFLALVVFSIAVQLGFSQVSIGGVTVSNSEPASAKVETKYGTFTIKQGTKPEYYPSGALKSFYFEDYGKLVFGGINILGGRIYITSPAPSNDALQNLSAYPVELYENGNLKSAKLADCEYDNLGGDKHLHIGFPKYTKGSGLFKETDTLAIKPKSIINFYDNEAVKSVVVTQGQHLSFLRAMAKTDKQRVQQAFKNGSTVEFYDDGYVKSFTPTTSTVLTIKNPLGIAMKPGTEITVKKGEENTAIGFYPANGSRLSLGEGINVELANGRYVGFYDDAKTLKELTWQYTISFTISNVKFFADEGHPMTTTVYFGEKGNIEKVTGLAKTETDFISGNETTTILPFVTEVEGKQLAVEEIGMNADGTLAYAVFTDKGIELSSKTVKVESRNGVEAISAYRIYYKDGKKAAATVRKTVDTGSDFYAAAYDSVDYLIYLYENGNVSRTVAVDGLLTTKDTISFSDDGRPVSYTYTNPVDKTTVTKSF